MNLALIAGGVFQKSYILSMLENNRIKFITVIEKLLWQELQNDYRTLIGVTIDKSDVNLPSKISKEEQKNV